jgi:hypothetical protein
MTAASSWGPPKHLRLGWNTRPDGKASQFRADFPSMDSESSSGNSGSFMLGAGILSTAREAGCATES